MAKVTLKNVNKFFGEVHAVKNLDLEIQQGDLFSVLFATGVVSVLYFKNLSSILYSLRKRPSLPEGLLAEGEYLLSSARTPSRRCFKSYIFRVFVQTLSDTN